MSLLKINRDLCSDFGKNTCIHTSIASFLEEQILSLSEAKVAILGQGLLIKVGCCVRWWELGNLRDEVLKDPCGLLEKLTGRLYSITREVHITGSSCHSYCAVIEG